MKKKIFSLLTVLFAAVFLISAWQLSSGLREYRVSRNAYEALDEYVSFEAPSPPTEKAPPAETMPTEITAEPTEPPDVSAWPVVDFEQLTQLNPEVVGWVYIEGTGIHYPLVKGTDNRFYLNHLFDGTYNSSGSIFLDYRCDAAFSDPHSVIYGHHMRNGTMFAELMGYKKQSFYDEHPDVLLVTPDAYYRIRLFSGYVADNSADAWDLTLSGEQWENWLEKIQKKSCFLPASLPEPDDRIVTLSTCSHEFSDAKFVVHGYISDAFEKTLWE